MFVIGTKRSSQTENVRQRDKTFVKRTRRLSDTFFFRGKKTFVRETTVRHRHKTFVTDTRRLSEEANFSHEVQKCLRIIKED